MNDFALSGAAILITEANNGPGNGVPVINWNANTPGCLQPGRPNPRHGMCSIHIDEWDEGPAVEARVDTANQYLVADVTYATEGRGGEFSVGITRGTVLAVGGVDVISVKAYFVSGVDGDPLVVAQNKRVQATITWPTSINPKEANISLPSITVTAGMATGFFKIPRQASSMIAYSLDPTHLATLRADFATTANAATIAYATLNPNANGTNIERGVEFVRFFNANNDLVTPVFSLWP